LAELESKLFIIYEVVTEWLKYTEAKHAGLLVVSAAGPAAILAVLYSSSQPVTPSLRFYLVASLLMFLTAGGISLLSFLPRVNRSHWLGLTFGWGKTNQSDNLHYFGDLAKYDPAELKAAISQNYGFASNDKAEREALDLCGQIVINSRIVRVKLRLFTVALVCILIGILIPILKILIAIFD
jgi:hypothetical protein